MLLAAEADGVVEVISVDNAAPGERIVIEGYGDQQAATPGTITIDEFFSIPIKVKDHHLYVDDKKLISSAGPVATENVKDGKVT